MKTLITMVTLVTLGGSVLFAQHIPPCQGYAHSTSICYGYATARAFGRGWNDPVCPASTLHFNNISSVYFDWHSGSSLSGIQVGDIVAFANHAAYVVSVSGGIVVDQVPYENGPQQTNVSLNTVIQAEGDPTGYWRRKSGWPIKLQNEFSGGTVKLNGSSWAAPYTFDAKWNNTHNIEADMDGQVFQGYVRHFKQWAGESGTVIGNSSSKATTVKRTDTSINTEKAVTAYFNRQFDITFQNNFVGVGNVGIIKVNDNQYTLPTSAFAVVEPNTNITGKCINQVYNGINYTFSNWSGGSTACQKTFTPSDHTTYIAYYTGKPEPVTITSYTGPVGSNIHIEWEEHPNTNVTKYQVWRQYKSGSTGQWYGPSLMATKNRGTTSYTDYEFIYTNGYTNDLLSYDIRAYYSVENSYADPNWITIYGEESLVKPTQAAGSDTRARPTTYALGNFPNPFNPETRIIYQLANDGQVTLTVFNLRGQEQKRLVQQHLLSGYYSATWDGRNASGKDVASGIYFIRLEIGPVNGGTRILTHRVLLLR